VSPGALSGLTAGLVLLSLAASTPSMAKAPPSPPGPPRPESRKFVIRPMPEAPGSYLLQQNRADTFFTGTGLGVRLSPPGSPARELQWGLAGARTVTPQPLAPRETRFHQFVGPSENWKRNLPTWGALYYPEVAPGVDLWFEAQEEGVAYSLRAERGVDLRQVRLEWRGAQALRVAEGGRALEVVLADGVLREEGLLCGQESADGSSLEVPCRYRDVRPKGPGLWEYVIEVDVKEPGRPAWVDPTLNWNTFLGGSGTEGVRALAILDTSLGDNFIVGSSNSSPVEPPSTVPTRTHISSGGALGMSDVVVSRLSKTGSVHWIAVLGGRMDDVGTSLAFGVDGYIYIGGITASNDFPRGTSSAALKPFQGGPTDGFVARLSSSGLTLDWVQLIGGSKEDEIQSLTITPGAAGEAAILKVYAAGWTTSGGLPPGTDTGTSGGRDMFVSRLDYLTGTVEKTLIRRGSGHEEVSGIAAAPQRTTDGGTQLYVAGYTASSDFPVGSGRPAAPGDSAGTAVVFKLDQELAAPPLWDSFLGGLGLERGSGLVVTSDRVTVVGTTSSSDFPTSDGKRAVGADAFLASLSLETGERVFSTVVGGSGNDEGLAIAAGTFGSFYIGGKTTSTTLPAVAGGVNSASAGASEGFVIRMGRGGSGFVPEWGTFVGGTGTDEVRALAAGLAYPVLVVAGVSGSDSLQRPPMVAQGAKRSNSGAEDMFLFSMNAWDLTAPKGVVRDGREATDLDRTSSTTTLEANWDITDLETDIQRFDFTVGTGPECEDVRGVSPAASNFVSLSSTDGGIPTLTPGRWYFVNVRATNDAGLSSTISSNGIFVLQPDGGPATLPGRPARLVCGSVPGEPGPEEPGPEEPGPEEPGPGEPGPGDPLVPGSPLGWSCGTPGGPTGFVLLVVAAFALLSARRRSRS